MMTLQQKTPTLELPLPLCLSSAETWLTLWRAELEWANHSAPVRPADPPAPQDRTEEPPKSGG